MSVQNISAEIQNSEQYKIRKQSSTAQAEEISEQDGAPQASQETHKVDEYDKDNPVGEEPEGIYSVSYDDEGNLKVDYKQPGAAPAGTASAEENSSEEDNEEEIKKLEKQRDILKQKLNREADENIRSQLRTQLQAIEMQIALKKSEA